MNVEIIKAEDYGIEKKQEQELLGNLPQIKSEREILEKQYNEIVLLDVENSESWKLARELRLLIQRNRTQGINVWHKTTKDFFLKGGQFVDAIKRKESAINERMEAQLLEIEKYEEIQRQKEVKRLNEIRTKELELYSDFVPMGVNFGEMSDDDYIKTFNGAKLQFEAEQARIRKEEEEKVEKERIQALHNERKEQLLSVWNFVSNPNINFGELSEEDFEQLKVNAEASKNDYEKEQERIRKENERLEAERIVREKAEAEKIAKIEVERKKEREEAEKKQKEIEAKARKEREEAEKKQKEIEAKARKEREEAEKKAEAERIARKKLEDEIKKKAEAEKAKAEELKKAPIREQMNAWIDSLSIPEINIENEIKDEIIKKFNSFKKWAKNEIIKL